MHIANTNAGIQSLFLLKYSADTAAKEAPVCPDGKEKSVGCATNSCTAVFTSHGRTRATNGFKSTLQQSTSSTRPTAIAAPAFLVFGKNSNTTAQPSHIAPPLPSFVTSGIAASRKPLRKWNWIHSNTESSKPNGIPPPSTDRMSISSSDKLPLTKR